MRRFIIGLAALAVIGLGGCSTNEPTPTVTVTATPSISAAPVQPIEPVTPGRSAIEQTFVDVYESEYGNLSTDGENDLIDLGHTFCANVRSDGLSSVVDDLKNSDLEQDELKMSGFILGSAIAAFCPEYSSELQQMVGSSA